MSLRNTKKSRNFLENLNQIEFINDIKPMYKEPKNSSKYQSELLDIVAAYLTVESKIIKNRRARNPERRISYRA